MQFLIVKRPSTRVHVTLAKLCLRPGEGLLAGQFAFPSVTVDAKEAKSESACRAALNQALSELVRAANCQGVSNDFFLLLRIRCCMSAHHQLEVWHRVLFLGSFRAKLAGLWYTCSRIE